MAFEKSWRASAASLRARLRLITLFASMQVGLVQAQALEYAVLTSSGVRAGRQVVTQVDEGALSVEFTFKENGRGPELEEEFVLAADGTFATYRVRGTSEFGASVEESFTRRGDIASWSSPYERGEARVSTSALYMPLGGSPAVYSVAIAALSGQVKGELALVPTGTMRIAKLAELEIKAPAGTQKVQLVSLHGLAFLPTLVWATTGPRPRLFALLAPAGFQLIESGWESSLPALQAQQSQAESEGVVALHERLVHRLTGSTLIRNARIFDSERASLGSPSNVLLREGRIAAIQPADDLIPADNLIEADGHVLLPGLFDMHSHVLPWEEGALHIAAGVTTMRDMGSDNEVLRRLMEQERAGKVLWPHVVPAGLIEGEGPMSLRRGILISTAAEAQGAVDWYAAHDYPQIKIYNSFPKDLVRETAAYAHAKGLRVSGHIPAFMRAEEAVKQGFDEIQHINQVMLNFLATDKTDSRTLERFRLPAEKTVDLDFDSRAVRDFVALLLARDTVLDPTLATFEFLHQRNGEMWPVIADIADHLPSSIQRSRRAAEMDIPDDAAAARYRRSFAKMVEFVGRAYRAGVPIVAGSDELSGFTLQRELELYVQAGITPAQVLQIATWNAAKHARVLDDRGSITVGKRADLILVDGNPTVRIADIRKVVLVLKDGNAYSPAEVHEELNIAPFAAQGSIRIHSASSN